MKAMGASVYLTLKTCATKCHASLCAPPLEKKDSPHQRLEGRGSSLLQGTVLTPTAILNLTVI